LFLQESEHCFKSIFI